MSLSSILVKIFPSKRENFPLKKEKFPTIALGQSGEDQAVGLLKKNGYRILERNYKTRLGEIDIIAQDNDVICFVEVKTRSSLRYGLASEAVGHAKQIKLSHLALAYLKQKRMPNQKARFDVVAVSAFQPKEQRLELIRNAFDLTGF